MEPSRPCWETANWHSKLAVQKESNLQSASKSQLHPSQPEVKHQSQPPLQPQLQPQPQVHMHPQTEVQTTASSSKADSVRDLAVTTEQHKLHSHSEDNQEVIAPMACEQTPAVQDSAYTPDSNAHVVAHQTEAEDDASGTQAQHIQQGSTDQKCNAQDASAHVANGAIKRTMTGSYAQVSLPTTFHARRHRQAWLGPKTKGKRQPSGNSQRRSVRRSQRIKAKDSVTV